MNVFYATFVDNTLFDRVRLLLADEESSTAEISSI